MPDGTRFGPIDLGPDDWIFCNHLRALVGSRFETWGQAAVAFELPQPTMSQIARGRAPSNATIRRMLEVMACTVDDLAHALDRPGNAGAKARARTKTPGL